MIFRLETPSATSTSLETAPPFLSFLVVVVDALGVAVVFFPAEETLELAYYFSLAKIEPFACAAKTMSSGLGSENAVPRKDDEEAYGIA
jgi:hypothetical protein